jgi:hypothetical protein
MGFRRSGMRILIIRTWRHQPQARRMTFGAQEMEMPQRALPDSEPATGSPVFRRSSSSSSCSSTGTASSSSTLPICSSQIQSVEPGKSAWEALEYIPIVLTITIIVTLAVAALRLVSTSTRPSLPANSLVAILGLVSMLLISFRIVDPPTFGVEETITSEGAVQVPIFLALLAAAGIAGGGWRAMREETDQRCGLPRRRA